MQDFFRCQEGFEGRTDAVATKCCQKLIVDMHYEACIQAVVSFHATVLGERVTKRDARTIRLSPEQYLQVNTLILFDINYDQFQLLLCRMYFMSWR